MIGRLIFLRNGRLSRRTWLVIAALFLAALVVFLPLRLVLGMAGGAERMTARGVYGTAWSGTIADLRVGALPLGTLDAGVRPLPLLVGRTTLDLSRTAPAANPFRATVSGGRDWAALRDVDGTVPLPEGLGPLPATQLGFAGFAYTTTEGRCDSAQGTVSLTLSPPSALMPGDLVLGGKARCDNGALAVDMAGPTGMERLTLRITPGGKWTADLVLKGLPVEAAAPLLQQGFAARDGGVAIRAAGSF